MSVAKLCQLFGKTRQAWYDRQSFFEQRMIDGMLILEEVRRIRKLLPRTGLHKLHEMLADFRQIHEIKLGRDRLGDLLAAQGLMLKQLKTAPRTTNSYHRFRKWPNLIEDLVPDQPEQLLVGDITYLRTKAGFAYLTLLTDGYSRKIMGYHLSENLATEGTLKALKMAIRNRQYPEREMIHHSDRGIQYCSTNYVAYLQRKKVLISMTQSGEPTDNAIAERINGILKQEMGLNTNFSDFKTAKRKVKKAVHLYNSLRLHASCNWMTPLQAHECSGPIKRRWTKKVWAKKAVPSGVLAAPRPLAGM